MQKTEETDIVIAEDIRMPAGRVQIQFAEGTTLEQANSAVEKVSSALGQQQATVQKLRLLLGKILLEVQSRELYSPQFKSFERYTLWIGEQYHMSRATVHKSLMIARNLPMLEPEQAEKIQLTNLDFAAQAARNRSGATVRGLIAKAQQSSVEGFKQYLVEKGYLGKVGRPRHEGKVRYVKILVPNAVADKWEEMIADQNQDAGQIFATMLKNKS